MSRESVLHAYQRRLRENVLLFDGTNDYITLGVSAPLSFERTNTFTVEAWVRFTTVSGSGIIAGNRLNSGTFRGWELFRSGTNLRFDLTNTLNTNQIGVTATANFVINKWYHVAVVYTGTSNATGIAMFIDGNTVTQTTNVNNLSATILNGEPIQIGTRQETNFMFGGNVSELRFWDDVRTIIEISQYKNTTLLDTNGTGLDPAIDTTDLVAYYPLNEGTGTTAIDYAGTVDGTLTNFTGTFWTTNTDLPLSEREYKAHTSRFIFSGIQSKLNTGVGSMDFTLPNITDVAGDEIFTSVEGVELQLDYTADNQPTKTIYNGLARISEFKNKNLKTVNVTALSAVEFLANGGSPLNYTSGTYDFIFNDQLENCFKIVALSYNNQNPIIPLNYTTTSIETTGKSVSIDFYNPRDYLTMFDALFKLSDDNWIWYIDSNNTLYLREISTSADFVFTYGKDYFSSTTIQDATRIVNRVKITNTTVNRAYTNQTSINTYGLKEETIKDERLSTTGMDQRADRILDSSGLPNEQLTATILDVSAGGVYDLSEGLIGKVFDVCNTDQTITNKIITTALYFPEKGYAEIVASDKESYVSRELTQLKNEQFQINFDSSVSGTYTEV